MPKFQSFKTIITVRPTGKNGSFIRNSISQRGEK